MTTEERVPDFEQDYFLRRFATRGRSYSVPVNPYPGECLEDLLTRAACENGHHPSMSYKLLNASQVFNYRVRPGLNRYGITAQALANLLGNTGGPGELMPLLESDAPAEKTQRPLLGVLLHCDSLSANRRVSPLALRKAPFLRAVWRVSQIGFDPETKETLLEDCPVCGKKLRAGYMGNVWYCDRCVKFANDGEVVAVDLRDFPQTIVSEHLWDDLDFATSFVDPNARDRRRESRSSLHPDFESVDDGQVFEVISGLARYITPQYNKVRRVSTPHFAEAARIVRNWPKEVEVKFGCVNHQIGLRPLFRNTRLDAGVRRRMQEIIEASVFRSTTEQVLPQEVQQTITRIDEHRMFKHWMSRGVFKADSTTHLTALVSRSKNEIRVAAKRLGIPVTSFTTLLDDVVLPKEFQLSGEPTKEADHIEALVQNLRGKSARTPAPTGSIKLARAVSAIFIRNEDPWRRVFRALTSGQLEFWLAEDVEGAIVGRLYVNNLFRLREILSVERGLVDHLHTVPVTVEEAVFTLRMTLAAVKAAVTAGFITRPFTRGEIIKFLVEFEPGPLLSARHRIATRGHIRDRLAARCEPVINTSESSVWRRADVERQLEAAPISCIF